METDTDELGVYIKIENKHELEKINNGEHTENKHSVAYCGSGKWRCYNCSKQFEIEEKIYTQTYGTQIRGGQCKECVEKQATAKAL